MASDFLKALAISSIMIVIGIVLAIIGIQHEHLTKLRDRKAELEIMNEDLKKKNAELEKELSKYDRKRKKELKKEAKNNVEWWIWKDRRFYGINGGLMKDKTGDILMFNIGSKEASILELMGYTPYIFDSQRRVLFAVDRKGVKLFLKIKKEMEREKEKWLTQ